MSAKHHSLLKATAHQAILGMVIMLALVAATTVQAATSVVASLAADYSGVQGQKGWYYHYSPAGSYVADSAQNQLLWKNITYYGTGWGDLQANYTGWSYGFAYQSASGAEVTVCPPDTWIGAAPASVTRWVSTVDNSNATISGSLQKIQVAGGDGVTAELMINGTAVWSQTLVYNNGDAHAFSVTHALAVGDRVDFVIRTGASQTGDVCNLALSVTIPVTPYARRWLYFEAGDGCDSGMTEAMLTNAKSKVDLLSANGGNGLVRRSATLFLSARRGHTPTSSRWPSKANQAAIPILT